MEEMNALNKNDTWKLVDLPMEKKKVECKWVFTIKWCKTDGSLEKYKARLVAKGSHYVLSMVSRLMHSPSPKHFDAVYKILKYLKGTLGRGLLFKKHEHLQVEVYNYADWAGV